ncbi:MarR family transcriptional regulator [uncultured Roseibium sp.]|uniref:MarR family winged helix-turn-helix transcriptional regulator n=1 Tax=uncultured Roseibium sp. TaxID=1936171 RepID=UPI00260E61AA|nr:MarR family transcriptional regulator [uncultured Roseibium sp.]
MNDLSEAQQIRDLIDRLTRLSAAEEWNGPLNPSQFAALSYLARANRYSRAPSHVADYLATTRGTASQTLKALARKSLIDETRSDADKRSIRYDVAPDGLDLLKVPSGLDEVINELPNETSFVLTAGLKALVNAMLLRRDNRSFGLCRTCKHHQGREKGGYCKLLEVELSPVETGQICHEHAAT